MSHLDRSSIAIVAVVLLVGIPFIVFASASAPTPSVVTESETKQPLVFATLTPIPTPVPTAAPAPVAASASLDLGALPIAEADNVRWSLIRRSTLVTDVYNVGIGVKWEFLRSLNHEGAFLIPATSTWSFNDNFGGGPGYRVASGVLAGGQCALATVLNAAALRAGLETNYKPHATPVPGYSLEDSVNIWWARDDLAVENKTDNDLFFEWRLSGNDLAISVAKTTKSVAVTPRHMLIKFSRYDPMLGPPNCWLWDDVAKKCLSNMTSGLDWREWYEEACACPEEFPFWTTVTLVESGRKCVCLDRGGAIIFDKQGLPFIDFLSRSWFHTFGSVHLAEVQMP